LIRSRRIVKELPECGDASACLKLRIPVIGATE
jgi:hypothetical protein